MYKKTILKNGIRLITVPLKDSKAVTVLVLVKAGSEYENKKNNGVSHFLEHMMFKGTKKRPTYLEISEAIDKVGGRHNAFTSYQNTGYWIKVDKDHADLALDLVSDTLINSTFPEKEIDKERKVILEEINMYEDEPRRKVWSLFNEVFYGDQPAGWKVSGSKKTVSAIKRSDILNYYKKRYVPSNIVAVVAGNFKFDEIKRKCEKYFALLKEEKTEAKLKVIEKQEKPQSLVFYKKTDQTHLCLGARAYNSFDKRKYALGILGFVLGGSMSSRLFVSVREKLGLAYYVGAGASLFSDRGQFMAWAGVNNDKVEKAIVAILKEFQKIKSKGITAAELKKAKEYVKGSMQIGLESSDDWADFYGDQELEFEKIKKPEEILTLINKVTLEDVHNAAKDILKPEKLNLALIGPFEDKKMFDKLLKI